VKEKMYRTRDKKLPVIFLLVMLIMVSMVFAAEAAGIEPETVVFSIGEKVCYKGSQAIETDAAPYIKDIGSGLGRTMVPVAFAAPALGSEQARWLADERKVLISKGDKQVEITIGSKELLVNGKKVLMDAAAEIITVGDGGGRTMLPIAFIAQALEVGYEWKEETREVLFYGKNVVFDSKADYGPDTGIETIEGNVIVKYPAVILNNLIVKGNLTIAEEVGDGDVTLNNITVNGQTFIRGGGKDSIHINGGIFRNVVIQNVDGQVRIVANTVSGLPVVVAEDASGEEIILQGNFSTVVVEAADVSITTQGPTNIGQIMVSENAGSPVITLSERTTVTNMILESKAEVKGTGTVVNAEIKADGVSFEKPPTSQTVDEGVIPPSTGPAPSTGGGGGSSDGGDSGGNSDDSDDSDDSGPPPGPVTYTLNVQVNPLGGGSAADSGNAGAYEAGAAVSLTAAANAGYVFVSWTSGGTIISREAAFSYTMPAANTSITANFLPEEYIPVATAAELNAIRSNTGRVFGAGTAFEGEYTGGLDKKYIQVAAIDLNVVPFNSGSGWQPLGAVWDTPFTGVYDGNGWGIANLFINRPTTDGAGLFGYVGEAGVLRGISVTAADVTGDEEVGILAGASEGKIYDCSSNGQVTGNVDTGGLVGISYNFGLPADRHALVKDSYSAAAVLNNTLYGGGLVGANYGKIETSSATGNVTGAGFGVGGYAGGLAGQNLGVITGSHASGDVAGDGAGGLVGENYLNINANANGATIEDSYATGAVSGRWSIGGLAGYSFQGTIDNCYAAGNVSGEEGVAGLAGEISLSTISNSFALNALITRSAGTDTHFGRIIGWESSNTLLNNHARDDMGFSGIDYTPVSAANGRDGADISDWTITEGRVTDYTPTPLSNDTTVSSKETYYNVTVHATSRIPADNPITEDSLAITSADLVEAVMARLNFPANADYKVLANATVAGAGGFETWDFDTLAGKADTDEMALHDVLLVRAADGTLRGYHFEVVPQVFFSEYVENYSGTRCGLEIYNNTDAAFNLAALDFKVVIYHQTTDIIVDTVNLTGVIDPGDVYVVASSGLNTSLNDSGMGGVVDQVVAQEQFDYNGNDVIVLEMGDLVLDRIGQMESFPENYAWGGYDSEAGEWVWTKDSVLARRPTITGGGRDVNAPFNPAVEWYRVGTLVYTGLGSHSISAE